MTNSEIDKICLEYGITNYTINDDGTIDVDGDVYLNGHSINSLDPRVGLGKRFNKLPIIFNKVTGDFNCFSNNLTTLDGSPRYVGGSFHFYCNEKLTSLKGCPDYVGGDFNGWCHRKHISIDGVRYEGSGIKNLEHRPEYIEGEVNLSRMDIDGLMWSNIDIDNRIFNYKEWDINEKRSRKIKNILNKQLEIQN